jgi:hypothetical protein
VQGAMESSYRGRRNLGKGRRIEGKVSMFLFRSVRILGTRFILMGGRFVTPLFSQENKTLKNYLYG